MRLLEEGLEGDDSQKVEQSMGEFLHASFLLTREAVLEFWPSLSLRTFEEIRDDEEDSDLADQLRQLLWNGDNLSPFASRLLSWNEGDLAEGDLLMTVPELNNYLVASVDFYEGLRPVCASGEFDVPVLNLLEPPSPPSLELPEVEEALLPAVATPEPLTMIELVWEPRPELVTGMAPPQMEEPPAMLKLLWETADLSLPEAEASQAGPREAEPEPVEPEGEELGEPDVEKPGELQVEELGEPEVEEPGELQVEDLGEPEVEELGEAEQLADLEVPQRAESRRAARPWAKAEPLAPQQESDGMELIAMSAAPLSPLEQKTQLIVKKKYLGYGKNSDGVMGYCGQLTLSRFDDAPVNARLECSNPLMFLSPLAASGKAPVVTYWMPPAAFPQPGGHLTINLTDQNKVLAVGTLFPQSRTDFLNRGQVLLLLLAPPILGLLYFIFVYLLSASGIVAQVKEVFPEAYAAAMSGSNLVDFRAQGVGLYQLEVVPAAESLQLIWAGLIWLCPLLSSKFFRHLSRSRQRDFGAALAAALLLPSLGLLLAWNGQKALFPLFEHVDFAPLDLRHFLPWSVPLNLVLAVYLFLSVHGVWDRKIPSRELRFLLPIALAAGYVAVAFMLIFARSWTA